MAVTRRGLLRGTFVVGATGLAGCDAQRDADDTFEGLARVEFANYDTAAHTLDVTISKGSDGGEVVERTVTLAPATVRTDGERTPTEEWVSDVPEQTGTYRVKWSMDDGARETRLTEDIQGCMVIRVEITKDRKVTVSLDGTVDCYGQEAG
ncbi:hypothetical protein [Halosimplex pelagicum]|uniref:Uncharacterized protein n=1 Tax=Halosimplex pelagicum TaxID=869886 RepID=A0A7D5TAU3_9EURY|nr:hypothetical protein [Halosimplex pelagicum]QLH83090.1 hypothetical protein HZS54_16310 [Halosimplex pelagicum]